MARASIQWDRSRPTPALYVYASGKVDGRRQQRRIRIAGDDEALAEEVARELNRRFLLGDFSFFEKASRAQTARKQPSLRFDLEEWGSHWLETYKPPVVELATWKNYRAHLRDLARRIGHIRLEEITQAVVVDLRTELETEGKRKRTVDGRLGVLRLILRDAKMREHIVKSPFDEPLPKRRTKQTQAQMSKRVVFRPFVADELETLLAVLRDPKGSTERMYFPVTEALLLTGLRWGEGAAWIWPHVSLPERRIHILHALPKSSTVEVASLVATKTAAVWSIRIRRPVEELLFRQRQRSYVGREGSWVFPNSKGGHLNYRNWLGRGWPQALERARVKPREGDAQKALRRSYITSALICGRNPKLVSSEVGHTTARMVLETYDSFIDPANWPDTEEREHLSSIFGWDGDEIVGSGARATHALRKAR